MKFEKLNNNRYRIIISAILTWTILILGSSSNLYSKRTDYLNKTVFKIEVKGNKNTDEIDIINSLNTKVGDILSEEILNQDIKNLFSTGNYYNIDIQAENEGKGIKIIIVLQERPKVKEIEFIGADEVFPSELRDKIPLKEGEVITPSKVEESKDLIMKKYREDGFFLAYVQVQLGKIDPATNLLKVKFIIDEGETIPVAKINIYGNEHVEYADIVGVLESKEEGTFETGTFNESSFESDKQKILGVMKANGYIDADVIDSYWEIKWKNPVIKDKRVIVITYKIQEGEKYFFNGYSIDHDRALNEDNSPLFLNKELNPPGTKVEDLKPVHPVKFISNLLEFTDGDIGKIFNEIKFFNDRNTINEQYSQKGYLFAQVVPNRTIIKLNPKELDSYNCDISAKVENSTGSCEGEYKKLHIDELKKLLKSKPDLENSNFVHIDINIRENHLAYIENVIIKGNKKTQDKVIRRQLLFKIGDLYNSQMVNRSRERIYNLGFFKEVNFNMRPGSDETKMNLIVEVVEQPSGTVSMGGGIWNPLRIFYFHSSW